LFREPNATARLVATLACGAVLLSCIPAAAQERRPARPYRGLFGPETNDAAQVLAVNGTLGIGYDTDVMAERRQIGLGPASFLRADDIYSLFAGAVSYSNRMEHFDVSAALSSAARNYSNFSTVSSHAASVAGTWRAARYTTIVGSHTTTYQPWGALIQFPVVVGDSPAPLIAPTPEAAVLEGSYSTYLTSASLTQQVSKRSSVTANYRYDIANFTGLDGDYRVQAGSLRYSHGLTRNLGWHTGYVYSQARFLGESTLYRTKTIDAGLDYLRNLSVTRRTRLSFSTGVMGIEERNYSRYGVSGTALLTREIGRTWDATASYTRGVAFFETLRVPYFYDGIGVGLGGLISRRVAFRSSAAATLGDVSRVTATVPVAASNEMATATGSAGLVVALTRYAAISGEYLFYAYSVDNASAILSGLTPQLTRHGVMVSLRAWMPVVERGRRTNAAR
jgi:hypothetical protein